MIANNELREKIFNYQCRKTQEHIKSTEDIFWLCDFSDEPHYWSMNFYEMVDWLIKTDDIRCVSVFDDFYEMWDFFQLKSKDLRNVE